MPRLTLGLLALLALAGCAVHPEPPPPAATPMPATHSVYQNGAFKIWSFCDRGSRVYVTEAGAIAVSTWGCPTGEP